MEFIRINSKQDLDKQLAQAKAMNRPVMVDYYADWCVACKEFEKYTFSDQSVQSDLERFVILQIDATQNSQSVSGILASQSVFGVVSLLVKACLVCQRLIFGYQMVKRLNQPE
ncbi:thioredoxin family protein [Vibrio rotiferianus]